MIFKMLDNKKRNGGPSPGEESAGRDGTRVESEKKIDSALTGSLVFLSSVVVLFVEMIEPKIFQFLKVLGHEMSVVAVAMLGLGISGLVCFMVGRMSRKWVTACSVLLGPSVLASYFVTVKVPYAVPAALVCCLPFFFMGMITGLSYIQSSSWKIYGLSLLGSGLGVAAMHVFLPRLGAESCMMLAATAAAAGGVIASYRYSKKLLSTPSAIASALLVICLAALGYHHFTGRFDVLRLAPANPNSSGLDQPAQLCTEALRLPGSTVLASRWSVISRVDAVHTPTLTSRDLAYPRGLDHVKNERVVMETEESFNSVDHLYANNVWFSSMANKSPMRSWLLPYTIMDEPRVLVIGVGGGIDLARAMSLSPRRLVGVEINPAVVDLLSGPLADRSSNVYNQAEIFVTDGRTFVHFTDEKFDLINLVFADLYIPFHFSTIFMESYLYTAEGFVDYYKVLSDGGVLAVTKMVGSLRAPTEILRITSTAMEAARRSGIPDPSLNVVVVGFSTGQDDVYGGTMLFKKTPFLDSELKEIRSELEPPLFPLYIPGEDGLDNPFTRLILAEDPSAVYANYPLNLEPPTDDKPFFYLFDRGLPIHIGIALRFFALTVVVFWIPFAVILSRKGRYKEPAYYLVTAYIFVLEIGYVFLQTSLVQKLNLYLGGPLYSLSVVVAAFLLYPSFTGALMNRLKLERPHLAFPLIPLSLLIYEPALVWAVSKLPPFAPSARAFVVFLLLLPLLAPLGLPFPFALEVAKKKAGAPAAGLFFGVAGTCAVIAVTVSLYWSARFGIQALFTAGVAAYLVVFVLGFALAKTVRV